MRNFKVGDIVKSYDFPGRLDCYMIGRVKEVFPRQAYMTLETIEAISEGQRSERFNDQDTFDTVTEPTLMEDMFTKGRLVLMMAAA